MDIDARTRQRGQAAFEFVAGLVALTILVTALIGISAVIVKSLDMASDVRAGTGGMALNGKGAAADDVVAGGDSFNFTLDWIFDGSRFFTSRGKTEERLVMPPCRMSTGMPPADE